MSGEQENNRRFEIQRCLGAGGFGEVYLATMTSPGGVERAVALKILHGNLDPRSQAVQRLRDEGRLLGALNHPAIPGVHDLVILEGRAALVMEYIDGVDLEQVPRMRPPLPAKGLLEALGQIAEALQVAHFTNGSDGKPLLLVHRDLKPSNIRIGRHGEVKLLDFGIAKAADARREAHTGKAVTIGSPEYMAPERWAGDDGGTAADAYSLGCTLFEMLHGERLFATADARSQFRMAVDQQRHDRFVLGRLALLDLSAVVGLLERLLAFKPEVRPIGHELVEALERHAATVPGDSLRQWCRSVLWPDPEAHDGELVGRALTEQRLSGVQTVQITREPRERPVAPPSPSSELPSWLTVGTLLIAFFAIALGALSVGASVLLVALAVTQVQGPPVPTTQPPPVVILPGPSGVDVPVQLRDPTADEVEILVESPYRVRLRAVRGPIALDGSVAPMEPDDEWFEPGIMPAGRMYEVVVFPPNLDPISCRYASAAPGRSMTLRFDPLTRQCR